MPEKWIVNERSFRDDISPIDNYRWRKRRLGTLLYPILLHSTPRYAHSIVPGGLLVMS